MGEERSLAPHCKVLERPYYKVRLTREDSSTHFISCKVWTAQESPGTKTQRESCLGRVLHCRPGRLEGVLHSSKPGHRGRLVCSGSPWPPGTRQDTSGMTGWDLLWRDGSQNSQDLLWRQDQRRPERDILSAIFSVSFSLKYSVCQDIMFWQCQALSPGEGKSDFLGRSPTSRPALCPRTLTVWLAFWPTLVLSMGHQQESEGEECGHEVTLDWLCPSIEFTLLFQ